MHFILILLILFAVRKCDKPYLPSGTVTPDYTIYGVGKQITFACNTGFKLEGSTTSQCVSSGSQIIWSLAAPVCRGDFIVLCFIFETHGLLK